MLARERVDAVRDYTDACTIQRGTPATDNTAASWTAHLSGIACAYRERTVRETADNGGVRFVRVSMLHLPYGTDIDGGDRVASVTDATGAQRLPGTMFVDGDPVRYADHIEVQLKRVSS